MTRGQRERRDPVSRELGAHIAHIPNNQLFARWYILP